MASYLYAYPAPLVFDEANPKPSGFIYDGEYSGQSVYLSAREQSLPNQTLVGEWDNVGVLQGMLDPLFDVIRPFGNVDGTATDQLNHHYWQGHKQRQVQLSPAVDTLPQYPADNQPIVLTMEYRWDETVGFEGHGWKATIEFSDPLRSPDARAIGIYNDAWAYQYTTGAFIWTDTGELDEGGVPLFKWITENPPGFATATREDVYYALLLGAAQEGNMLLPADTDSLMMNFWEANQDGAPLPPGWSWVDSGVTTNGMAGTVTLTAPDNTSFTAGQTVRIDGVESTITSLWTTGGLVLDPFISVAAGLTIEVQG